MSNKLRPKPFSTQSIPLYLSIPSLILVVDHLSQSFLYAFTYMYAGKAVGNFIYIEYHQNIETSLHFGIKCELLERRNFVV